MYSDFSDGPRASGRTFRSILLAAMLASEGDRVCLIADSYMLGNHQLRRIKDLLRHHCVQVVSPSERQIDLPQSGGSIRVHVPQSGEDNTGIGARFDCHIRDTAKDYMYSQERAIRQFILNTATYDADTFLS